MPRKSMQDIVPKDGRSIRNIPISETRSRPVERKEPVKEIVREIKETKKEKPQRIEEKEEKVNLHYIRETPPEKEFFESVSAVKDEPREEFLEDKEEVSLDGEGNEKKGKNWKLFGVIGAVVAVIALAVGVSTIFHGATLTITPRTAEFDISGDFGAKKNASLGELPFQVVTIKQTGSETVKATGEKQVDKRASGIITIYNNYSGASQRLIKNTRFSTPEGLIFRIADSVTVPGKVGTTPGSIEATVTADEPGEKYNVGLKDFTIPGFKGDPRFTGFYARSKTPLLGGFSGVQKVVADADRAKAKVNIESKIITELLKLAPGQVPEDSIFFDKAYKIDFTVLPEENVGTSEVTLKEEGSLSMVIFNKEKLSSVVAKKYVEGYNKESILITNLDQIIFVSKGDLKLPLAETIDFSLAGKAMFEWTYDELSLKQALAGSSRSEVPTVLLQKFPMIQKADISIRPFWLRKFPKTLDKITIKKTL